MIKIITIKQTAFIESVISLINTIVMLTEHSSLYNFSFSLQEAERIRLHELLETETIKASGLRYKLHYFPGDISSEIQGNLHVTRDKH